MSMRNTTPLLTAAALLALTAATSAQPVATSTPPPTQMAKQFQFTRTQHLKRELPPVPAEGLRRESGEALAADPVLARRGRARHERLESGHARPAQERRRAPGLPVYRRLAAVPGTPGLVEGRAAGAAGRDHSEVCGGHEPDLPDRAEHGGLRHVGPRAGLPGEVCGHRADLRRRPTDFGAAVEP